MFRRPPRRVTTEMLARRWEFDALRGLMLVLMTLTHVPTHLSSPLGQPFGFTSAAFGFVLMSGFMAGMVYTRRGQRAGDGAMVQALCKRAWTVYLCHLGLITFLFGLIPHSPLIQHPGPVPGMLWFYSQDTFSAVIGGVLMLHQPGLFDILPMYVLLLLVTGPVLLLARRVGWRLVMLTSMLIWAFAQWGASPLLFRGLIDLTGLPIPNAAGSAFDLLAWQMIWIAGLMFGNRMACGQPLHAGLVPPPVVVVAIIVALIGFTWRHWIGQVPFPDHREFNFLLDKWHFGPLRFLNAAALTLLVMRYGPWLVQHGPKWPTLTLLGQASLPVFCAHVLITVAILGLIGDEVIGRALGIDAVILAVTFGLLIAVAWVARHRKARKRLHLGKGLVGD